MVMLLHLTLKEQVQNRLLQPAAGPRRNKLEINRLINSGEDYGGNENQGEENSAAGK